MLISVIGSRRFGISRRHKQAGFTLVEVMVSLFIMGLMAGAVIITMPERENALTLQTKKIMSHLKMAAQTSLIEQQPIGVQFNEEGYSLVKYNDGEWAVIKDYPFDDGKIPLITLSQNGTLLDFEAIKKSKIPIIRYNITGLATPFVLSLGFGGEKSEILGRVDGSIVLAENGG